MAFEERAKPFAVFALSFFCIGPAVPSRHRGISLRAGRFNVWGRKHKMTAVSMTTGSRLLMFLSIALAGLAGAQMLVILRSPALAPLFSSGTLGGSFAPMLEKVIPGVVTIRVTGEVYSSVEIEPRRDGPHPGPVRAAAKEPFRSGGSGVIVDPAQGYILTNNHVVENATKIDVGLSDGRRMLARLIGRDIGTDLAVIKVEPKSLPSIAIGDSDIVRVGDVVVAVGNPFGLEGTATLGIIGAVMRNEIGHESFEDYLQVDAQTNPGNSGGGLVNVKGELVGINTVVAGGRGQGYTIGFAIPINMARVIQAELVAHGRMRRGAPGIVVSDQTDDISYDDGPFIHGAVVTKVFAGSSAESAGIKPGDLVIKAANKPVRSAAEYMTRVSTVPVGSAIPLMLLSGGKARPVLVDVGTILVEPVTRTIRSPMGSIAGAVVGDILPGNVLYGDLRGAQILQLPATAPAYAAGFEVGDVIVKVEGERVRNTDELFRRLEQTGLQYRVDIVRKGLPAWMRIQK